MLDYNSKFKKNAARLKGFTLIELLIYMSILTAVLLFTAEFLYAIGQARLRNISKTEISASAQLIMAKIKSDVENSSALVLPGGSEPAGGLQLQLSPSYQVSYILENETIKRTLDSETFNLNSNQTRVKNLSFQKVANAGGKETIQVKFSVEPITYTAGTINVAEEFQTTLSRR